MNLEQGILDTFKISHLNISSGVGHRRAVAVLIDSYFYRTLGSVAQVVLDNQLEYVLAFRQTSGIAFGSSGSF